MSEVKQCPVCGGVIRRDYYGLTMCGKCRFACEEKDLPRIVTAMRLAKASMDFFNNPTARNQELLGAIGQVALEAWREVAA